MARFHTAIVMAKEASLSLSLGLFQLSSSDSDAYILLHLASLGNGYRNHSKFSESDVAIAIAFAK